MKMKTMDSIFIVFFPEEFIKYSMLFMCILFQNYTKIIWKITEDPAIEKCSDGGSCQGYFIFEWCGYSGSSDPLPKFTK